MLSVFTKLRCRLARPRPRVAFLIHPRSVFDQVPVGRPQPHGPLAGDARLVDADERAAHAPVVYTGP